MIEINAEDGGVTRNSNHSKDNKTIFNFFEKVGIKHVHVQVRLCEQKDN